MSAAEVAARIKEAIRGCGSSVHDDAINQVDGIMADWEGMPNAEEFDESLRHLEAVMALLSQGQTPPDRLAEDVPVTTNRELSKIDTVTGELTEWTGQAMETFRDYVQPFHDDICMNLWNATRVLHGALTAQQAMWQQARQDAERICEQIIDCGDGMCYTGGGDQMGLTLTVIGSVVAVALAVPTGGYSIGVAAVAGVFSVAGSAVGTDFDVKTPEEAVEKLRESLGKVNDYIKTHEDATAQALTDMRDALEADGYAYALETQRIDLHQGPGGLDGRR